MTRLVLVLLFAVTLLGHATAEPLSTWNYRVYTLKAPAQIVGSDNNLSADAVVELSLASLLDKPVPSNYPLPDPASWGDKFSRTDETGFGITFHSNGNDPSSWHSNNVYGRGSWYVTQQWEKVSGPNGLAWKPLPQIWGWSANTNSGEWAFANPHRVGDQTLWDRFNAAVDEEGNLTLSMTPDVPNPYATPEPATIAIVGVAAGGFLFARLRRRRMA